MTNIIKLEKGKLVDFDKLPVDLQEKIKQYAIVDIYKDQAKQNIKAGQVNIQLLLNQWLNLKNSINTKSLYKKAINDFFLFLASTGINPLLIKAENVDQYILNLKNSGLSDNSIRVKLMSCSSFYSMLSRYDHIKRNPFKGCKLPMKTYKKAINQDQNKTVPVLNKKDFSMILNTVIKRTKLKGSYKNDTAKKSAFRLFPVIHFMAVYGLRVGAIETILIDNNKFSYKTKGNKSSSKKLLVESIHILKRCKLVGNKPFKDFKKPAIQKSLKKLINRLVISNDIRYKYSAHDFRHFFAHEHYKKYKDIVLLKSLLDHSSINITEIYLQSIGIK